MDDGFDRIGCIVCRLHYGVWTKPERHHIRKLATSKKRKNAPKIPLCFNHHTAGIYGTSLHAGEKAFENKFGPVLELLDKTTALLNPPNQP